MGLPRRHPNNVRRRFAEEPPRFRGDILRIHNPKTGASNRAVNFSQSELAAAPRVFVRDAFPNRRQDSRGPAEEVPARQAPGL